MDIDVSAPEQLVDLDRYPVLAPGSTGYRQVVAQGQAQLAALGAAELAGFVSPAGVAALVADAESLAPRAHRSGGQGTAYREIPDPSLPEGHPRCTWGDYAVGAVAYDLIPRPSPLRRLYEWSPMTRLIADILDRGTLFPYADPFGALNLAVMGDGDQLQWHFDPDRLRSVAGHPGCIGRRALRGRSPGEASRRRVLRQCGRGVGRGAYFGGDPGHGAGDPAPLRRQALTAPGVTDLGNDPPSRRPPGLRHHAGNRRQ